MKQLSRLPDAEFEVMHALWECGGNAVPTGELSKRIEKERKAQTILTMLTRLADKGFIESVKIGKERVWTAIVTETEYRNFEAKNIVDKVYGGSFSELISAFYQGKGLSDEEAKELLLWIEKKTEKKE